jgi:hypothetical protein
VVQLVALVLVVALVRPCARRLPAWLLLFPAWVGTGLLFQIAIAFGVSGLFSAPSPATGVSADPIQPWVYVVVYSAFIVQGCALGAAFAAHVKSRWGRVFSIRSGELVVGDNARTPSWPERHFIGIAVTVAWMALATAIVFAFWSGGGAFALSGAESERVESMQVARASGAALAALGLFGLAGRLGAQKRFWWPAAFVWIGSGALVAFDGLALLFNALFAIVGTDALSDASWQPTDTALLIKVLVGMLVAAVGLLAARSAAAEDDLGRTAPPIPIRPPDSRSTR